MNNQIRGMFAFFFILVASLNYLSLALFYFYLLLFFYVVCSVCGFELGSNICINGVKSASSITFISICASHMLFKIFL